MNIKTKYVIEVDEEEMELLIEAVGVSPHSSMNLIAEVHNKLISAYQGEDH